MIYLKEFDSHSSYESEVNVGGVDINLPNVSYCNDVNDVHFNPYNLIEFYVGDITGTTPQTVKIYTDSSTYIPIQVSKGNKWYSYVLPKGKGLCKIVNIVSDGDNLEFSNVTKTIVKANINYSYNEDIGFSNSIPMTTVEASFKGSNTSKVTNMKNMFFYCINLTSLDLSSFDTSNVTNMEGMFYECSGLTSLDISNFDTSKVTSMNGMFYECSGLTSLDVSNFDTSNVTDMGGMFDGCTGITSLDVSNFDTSNLDYVLGMFSHCSSLESLDLSRWNTRKLSNMSMMFSGCSGLTSLDLSGWDMSNSGDISSMFIDCSALKTIKMIGCKQPTIDKIKERLTESKITGVTIVTE